MDSIDANLVGLAVAIGLGLLVGLQRERIADKPIGLRSFALIGMSGGLTGIFTLEHGGWILAAGLLSLTIGVFSHSYFVSRRSDVTRGMTTELAAIAIFLIGALATSGELLLATVLGGAVTLLLQWKAPMHAWVRRVGEVEIEAIARFVLIAIVVLPILPDETYGPYSVLNPRQIWLMVVLIVGLNLAGFVSMKLVAGRSGALLSGVLGGLISSTATTVSFATRCRVDRDLVPVASIVILVASILVYARILIETVAVAPELLPALILPVLGFVGLFAVVIATQLARVPAAAHEAGETRNPAQLKTASSFGLLYSVVLFISAAVNEHFGESMLFLVAVVSGLTDVDAITLSIARLHAEGRIDADSAWRIIFIASLSNLLFKAGVVAVMGGAVLRRRLVPLLGGLTAAGVAGTWWWP